MYKIVSVNPEPDYRLHIDFDDGSRVIYNMQNMVRVMPYNRLGDWEQFKRVHFDENSVYWEEDNVMTYFPLRLSIDTILFSLRN